MVILIAFLMLADIIVLAETNGLNYKNNKYYRYLLFNGFIVFMYFFNLTILSVMLILGKIKNMIICNKNKIMEE